MPTAACGINCNVCKLNLLRTCSSCGAGTSPDAKKKLAAQQRLMGSTCSILACANMNQIEYCMRDCNHFPCDNFRKGHYPFSQTFLDMQQRRLKERPPALAPDGSHVTVAAKYWNQLQQKNINMLCNLTLSSPFSSHQIIFHFLREDVMVDFEERCLKRWEDIGWVKSDDPFLELVTVVYLINVQEIYPIGRDIVGVKDLKEGHFFQGPHELKIDSIVKRYGRDLNSFRRTAEYLEGEAQNMADVAYKFLPFPRIPLYFLLWKGDDEFEPRMTVLFDRSIEKVFAADAIWALVNRVSTALVGGPQG